MSKILRVYPTLVKGKEYKFTYMHDVSINLSNVEMVGTEDNCSLETGYFEITMIFNTGRVCVLQYDDYDNKCIDYLHIIDAMGL